MSNKSDLIERVKLMTSIRDGDLFAKTCAEARAEIYRLLESNQYKLSANLSNRRVKPLPSSGGVSRHIKLIATSIKIKTLEEDMGI